MLRAGGKYVGVVGGQLQVVDIYQATEFGLGNIQTAYVNAGTLLKRYGKYFTLDITYDKDKDGEYETDLTSIFEGDFYNAGFDEKNGKYFIKDANGIVLYAGNNSHVVNAKGELVGYNSNDAVETVWALTPHETSTKGKYELRLKDKDGNFLTVGDKFVTVDDS